MSPWVATTRPSLTPTITPQPVPQNRQGAFDHLISSVPTPPGTGCAAAGSASPAAAAAAAAASANVAYDGTLDGSVIFNNLCGSCHSSGVGGAPTLSRADWTSRIAQGVETLHTHAIEGFTGNSGIMPPKGGNPALTDEQVVAAVDWMLDNLE